MVIGMSVLVLTGLLSLSYVAGAGVTFVEQPDDANINTGETVVFKCRVSGYVPEDGILVWIISLDGGREFLFGPVNPAADSDLAERYSITGDPSLGHYDLQIIDVQDTDAGLYRCLASTTLSKRATLTVDAFKPPDDGYPKCYGDHIGDARHVGDRASVRCESKGGLPAAILTWHSRDSELLQGHYTSAPHAEHVYEWTLTAEDNGKVLTCTATSSALSAPRTCTVGPWIVQARRSTAMPINSTTPAVESDQPTVKILPTVNDVVRGDEVVFTCILSVRAEGSLFSWKIGDTPIQNPSEKYRFENQNRTLRFQAEPSDDFTLYYCEVRYDSGNTMYASALLRVHGDEAGSASTQTSTIVGVSVAAVAVIVLFVIALLVYLHYRKLKQKTPDGADTNITMTVRQPGGTVLGQAPVDREAELHALDMQMFQDEGPDIMFRNPQGKTLYVYQNGEAPSESFS